jgi:hypothetical protein
VSMTILRRSSIIIAAAALALGLAGCSWFSPPTTEYRGKKVTADQLQAAVERDVRAEAERATADAEKARADAARLEGAFKARVAALDADHRDQVLGLTGEFESKLAELQLAAESARRRGEQAVADIRGEAEAARADIDRQMDQLAGIASLVQSVTGLVPGGETFGGPVSALVSLVLGGGAVGVMQALARRKADQAWDDAEKAKEAEVKKRDDTWDAAQAAAQAQQAQNQQLMTALVALMAQQRGASPNPISTEVRT